MKKISCSTILLFVFMSAMAQAEIIEETSNNSSSQRSTANKVSFSKENDNISNDLKYVNEFGFQTISSLKTSTAVVTLEKKCEPSPKRKNEDGKYFYKTTLAVGFQTDNGNSHDILDTDLYTESGLINENLPCMLIEPTAQKIYVFASSKSPKKHGIDKNAMDGFIYTYDMASGKWKKETLFSNENWGWYSFFGGSYNGGPELWHYSMKNHQIMYGNKIFGFYNNLERGSYSLNAIQQEYPHRRNILVASSPDVQPMANDNKPKVLELTRVNTPKTESPRNSNSSLRAGAALVGTGLLAYGIFKLLSSGLSSTSTSYYSGGGSYTSGSSYSSSYSSSSSSNSSSSSSSSNSSQTTSSTKSGAANTHTCKLTIQYETINGNWHKLIQENIQVTFHKDRFSQSGGYEKFWVDSNGNCTITWSDDRGDSIERISFSENGHGYCIKDISLKDGGTYSLKAPWNW
ncbi:MAG: hypothetical protein K6E52_00685 [Bacteroidaceae bacterium]|nr:hypothetical protein [Bacteroidaceae bacterium]